MNKEELKLKLVEIFSKRYEETTIDEQFVSTYKSLFWQSFVETVGSVSKSGIQYFYIDQWCVSTFRLPIPQNSDLDQERFRIYEAMFPLIGKWLDEMGVKYYLEKNITGNCSDKYKILVPDLKNFSNIEILGVLK